MKAATIIEVLKLCPDADVRLWDEDKAASYDLCVGVVEVDEQIAFVISKDE